MNIKFLACPQCGYPITEKHELTNYIKDKNNYCTMCGKPIIETLKNALNNDINCVEFLTCVNCSRPVIDKNVLGEYRNGNASYCGECGAKMGGLPEVF